MQNEVISRSRYDSSQTKLQRFPMCWTWPHAAAWPVEPIPIAQLGQSAQEIHRETGTLHDAVAPACDPPQHARHVDADQLAAPLSRLAGDKHGVDVDRVHQVDHRARR